MDYSQMLLFEEPLDIKVKNELKRLKDSNDRVRKSQFAKIGELRKKCDGLEERLLIIERGLCRPECKTDLHAWDDSDNIVIKEPRKKREKTHLSAIVVKPIDGMYLFHQPSAY